MAEPRSESSRDLPVPKNIEALCCLATGCLLYAVIGLPGHTLIGQLGAVLFISVLILSLSFSVARVEMPREWLYIGLMICIIGYHILLEPTVAAIVDASQQLLFLLMAGCFCITSLPMKRLHKISKSAGVLFAILIFAYTIGYMLLGEQVIQQLLAADLTKVLFAGSLFCVLAQTKNTHRVVACFLLAGCFWIMREASAAALLVCLPFVACVVRVIARRGFSAWRIAFVVLAAILVSFPLLYLSIYDSPFGVSLQEWFGANLQRRLFNGREVIWDLALQQIAQAPLLGQGLNSMLFPATADAAASLTTHNLYLYLALEGGVFLVAVFFLFLYEVWKRFWNNSPDYQVIYFASYFILILVMMDYELALFSKTVVSLFLWIDIGLGVAVSNQRQQGEGSGEREK